MNKKTQRETLRRNNDTLNSHGCSSYACGKSQERHMARPRVGAPEKLERSGRAQDSHLLLPTSSSLVLAQLAILTIAVNLNCRLERQLEVLD